MYRRLFSLPTTCWLLLLWKMFINLCWLACMISSFHSFSDRWRVEGGDWGATATAAAVVTVLACHTAMTLYL